jgi:urease accessory protein
MLVQNKIGHIDSFQINDRSIDYWELEWYECQKRIIRKKTKSGLEISFKSLNENPVFTEGDIIFENETIIVVVSVIAIEAITIKANSMFEMASICYEIGNKHVPLFYQNEELIIPFEKPLFDQLAAQGYEVFKNERKLLFPLRTSVSSHAHQSGESLFTKIMKLTGNE